MQIQVLIADDYYLIREGIKKSLRTLQEVVVVGEANNTDELMVLLSRHKPDITILEINLCQKPLKELITEMRHHSPDTKVLIISDCNCELPVIISIRAGISGFIRKNVSQEELGQAVISISQGKEYFSSEITRILMNGYLSGDQSQVHLSDREMEILRYICKGRSNEQIAEILFISEKTAGTHKKNIMKKAAVKKTSDLIVWAMDNNLCSTAKNLH